MRSCPFQGCKNGVLGACFCCTKHWHSMPRVFRDQAFNAYRRYCDKAITMEELVVEQCRIADESDFQSNALTNHVKGGCRYSKCFLCGFICFDTHYEGQPILLDTQDTPGGEFVVVANVAMCGEQAQRRIKLAPALARLNRHVCVATAANRAKAG